MKEETMKARTLLVCMYLANFLIGVFSCIYLLNSFWNHMELWQTAHYIYFLTLALCGVVLALWIAADGKNIERYAMKIRELETRILDFEKKIDHIKASVRAKS